MIEKLTFSKGNAKLGKETAVLSLPAGYSCPFAKQCRSYSNRETGKITDGPHCQFRCYAVSAECLFKNIRESRWRNFEALKAQKTVISTANLIERSILPMKNVRLVRLHQSGDFFSQAYFDAWLMVAKCHPEWIIYGYTKALAYWSRRLGEIPSNLRLVASYGGTQDALIGLLGLRSARVVFSVKGAKELGLELDHDDSHVWNYDKDFAILLHGTQPAGSDAGKACYQIQHFGGGGYRSSYFEHYKPKAKQKAKHRVRPKAIPVMQFTAKVNGMRAVLHKGKVKS